MKKYMVMLALLQMLAVVMLSKSAFAEQAVPLNVGALKIYPVLELKESYDDNIFLEANAKTSSLITKITPSVSAVAELGSSRVTVHYSLSKGFYHSSAADNYLDQDMGVDGRFGLTKRLKTGASLSYSKNHYTRGSTFLGVGAKTFLTPDKFHQIRLGGNVSYGVRGRIDASGRYTNFRYDNNLTRAKDLDLDTLGGTLAFSFPVGLKTRAVVETRYDRFNYRSIGRLGNLDNNEQGYFVGLDWQATAKSSGKVRFGFVKKNFSNAAFTNFSQFSWELDATWKPLSVSSLTLKMFSKPLESDGTSRFILSNATRLIWQHDWTQAFSHRANIGYDSRDYKGLARQDKITSVSFGLDYKLLRWLSLGGGYDFTNRSSNVVNGSYKQNVWSLSFRGIL